MFKILFFIVLSLSAVLAVPSNKRNPTIAPLIVSRDAEIVPDQYIVVLKKDVPKDRITTFSEDIPGMTHTYKMDGFHGFAGRFSEQMLDIIRQNNDVSI